CPLTRGRDRAVVEGVRLVTRPERSWMMRSRWTLTLFLAAGALAAAPPRGHADSIAYDNTATSTGVALNFGSGQGPFNTSLYLDDIAVAPGAAGRAITRLEFLAHNSAFADVEFFARLFLWAANGPGGNPGTFLAEFRTPALTLQAFSDLPLKFDSA